MEQLHEIVRTYWPVAVTVGGFVAAFATLRAWARTNRAMIEEDRKRMDKIEQRIDEHAEEDRARWMEFMEKITTGLGVLSGEVREIRTKVDLTRDDVSDLKKAVFQPKGR